MYTRYFPKYLSCIVSRANLDMAAVDTQITPAHQTTQNQAEDCRAVQKAVTAVKCAGAMIEE